MLSSLRSRLWLSYAFLIVTALSVVTIVLFISLFRNPLLYRQTTERLNAVQTVLIERSQEPNAPPVSVLVKRSRQTFGVRILLFSQNQQLLFDTSSTEMGLPFPPRRAVLQSLPTVRDEAGRVWLYSIGQLSDGTYLMVADQRPRFTLVNAFSDEFLPVILLSGGIALLLSLIVAFVFAGWIANPLQKVVNAAAEMPSAATKVLEV
ncbi:MAG TPA: hypothetical protein DCY14_00960, partial [Anaerolineae bacterium]|nr:hypothetical protein [Anaerolineae bacterium]